jgi:hypothetical protein
VSLSGESFEAVFLSDGTDLSDVGNNEGGDKDMDPKEIQALIDAGIAKAVEPLQAELSATKTALEESGTKVAELSASLAAQSGHVNEATVKADLDAMVEQGLPPAIAELSAPILLAGAGEVNLSSGETSTVGTQMRAILALIPKVNFSETGEAGIPDGAHVVLSAEQVKALGFEVPEGGGDAELSAEAAADKAAIESVVAFIPKDKRKEA